MAHYDDVIMSQRVRFGSASRVITATDQTFVDSGYRKANQRWSQRLRVLSLAYMDGPGAIYDIQEIFQVMDGPANTFLCRDWSDWNTTDGFMEPSDGALVTNADQPLKNIVTGELGLASGNDTEYQMVKQFTVGSATYVQTIRKPVTGTVKVAVDSVQLTEGVDYTVDYATGIVSAAGSPGFGTLGGSPTSTITYGAEFRVPVHFVDDNLVQVLANAAVNATPDVTLREVRL